MPCPGRRLFKADDQLAFSRAKARSAPCCAAWKTRVSSQLWQGSGKCSVVRAGLLPAFEEGFLFGAVNSLSVTLPPGFRHYQQLQTRLVAAAQVLAGTDGRWLAMDVCCIAEPRRARIIQLTDHGLLAALAVLGTPRR
jgi:hypothetical protein